MITVDNIKLAWMGRILAVATCLPLSLPGANESTVQQSLPMHETHLAANDLTLSGNLSELPPGSQRYVAYSDLLKLPQATFTVEDDSNFKGKAEITGIYLDDILRMLNIPQQNTLVAAICDDQYEAHYTFEYRATHHPILVLRINGKKLNALERNSDGGTYGPYLISHASFAPRYRVLAYSEMSQIPNGVVELRFLNETAVFSAIHPAKSFPLNSPEISGYRIAQGNCLRCHNEGAYGGHKAGIPWTTIGHTAMADPKKFANYIRNPRSVNAFAHMPGFPMYDNATLSALTAYFKTFATEQQR